jgi:hypothetical protein
MNHQTVIREISRLIPQMRNGQSAEDVLLKYANANNLSPAQLEKFGQVFNSAKALSFMDKHASDRGGDFPLLDVENLVAMYTKAPEIQVMRKSASIKGVEPSGKLPNLSKLVYEAESPIVKSAAAPEPAPMIKSADDLRSEELARRQEVRVLGDIRDDAYAMFDKSITKLARAITDRLDKFGEMEEDVLNGLDEHCKSTIKYAAERLNFLGFKKVARFNAEQPTKRRLAFDRHGIYGMVKEAADHLGRAEAACHLIMEKIGAAAEKGKSGFDIFMENTGKKDPANAKDDPAMKTNDPGIPADDVQGVPSSGGQGVGNANPRAQQSGKGDANSSGRPKEDSRLGPVEYITVSNGETPDKGSKEDRLGKITAAIREILPGADSTSGTFNAIVGKTDDQPGGMISLLSKAYAPKHRQKKLDEAVRDVSAVSNLQRLIVTDPILNEADPQQLTEIYNDLVAIDPDLAHNQSRLRFALRESLQYGGIPAQTVQSLAQVSKTKADSDMQRAKLMKEIY